MERIFYAYNFHLPATFLFFVFFYFVGSHGVNLHTISEISKIGLTKKFMCFNILATSSLMTTVSQDARESIAKSFSKIPGYGQPDIFYPTYFLGEWRVNQTISTSISRENGYTESNVIKPFLTSSLSFQRRYIKYQDNIILERSFSETNYFREYLSDRNSIAAWDITNPNNLNVLTSSGESIDKKITKRSIEKTEDVNLFGYSEYFRISEVDQKSPYDIPKIFGARLLARYKVPSERKGAADASMSSETINSIDGMERLYLYPGDTLDLNQSKPLAAMKSVINMKRIDGS